MKMVFLKWLFNEGLQANADQVELCPFPMYINNPQLSTFTVICSGSLSYGLQQWGLGPTGMGDLRTLKHWGGNSTELLDLLSGGTGLLLRCSPPEAWPWDLRLKPAAAKSRQSCPTLCDPIDSSPPGSPVPGILQARTVEWVAISFSNA